jgi:hypothetical protein
MRIRSQAYHARSFEEYQNVSDRWIISYNLDMLKLCKQRVILTKLGHFTDDCYLLLIEALI